MMDGCLLRSRLTRIDEGRKRLERLCRCITRPRLRKATLGSDPAAAACCATTVSSQSREGARHGGAEARREHDERMASSPCSRGLSSIPQIGRWSPRSTESEEGTRTRDPSTCKAEQAVTPASRDRDGDPRGGLRHLRRGHRADRDRKPSRRARAGATAPSHGVCLVSRFLNYRSPRGSISVAKVRDQHPRRARGLGVSPRRGPARRPRPLGIRPRMG